MVNINKPQRIFGTVRAFAEKGRLLSSDQLESLADSKDLEELETRLKNTAYNEVLSKLQRPLTAEKIENLLRENLARFHASMAKIVPNDDIINAYYTRYIIGNLKIILKGKALNKTYEQIFPHINMIAEEIVGRRDVIVKALVAKDLDEAVSTLQSSEFGTDVVKANQAYREKGNVQVFDLFLDHTYFQAVASAYETIGRPSDAAQLVSIDIDSYNALGILRAKYWELPESTIRSIRIKPTFRINEEVLNKMINADNIRDAIAELSSTTYRKILPSESSIEEMISQIEKNFDRLSYRRSLLSYNDIFSYGTMIGAIKLKLVEVRNLGAISFGVEQNVGKEGIKSKLLLTEQKQSFL